MERIQDGFLEKLDQYIPLRGLSVLEIGCGNGSRSVGIATRSKILTAIDPDISKIEEARNRGITNATFEQGFAESLIFKDASFNVVIFTLSFHHVSKDQMNRAIDEAIRVIWSSWYIVFFEPTEQWTFFDSEIQFDACDGDERLDKKNAYQAMMNHTWIRHITEFYDETILAFDSDTDFIESLFPKRDIEDILAFLTQNSFLLNANRRINIFQAK